LDLPGAVFSNPHHPSETAMTVLLIIASWMVAIGLVWWAVRLYLREEKSDAIYPQYRVVTDQWSGFQVQVKRHWWTRWQMPRYNSSESIEQAEKWLADYKVKESRRFKVVKYLPNEPESE
jgi:hypothetical protein